MARLRDGRHARSVSLDHCHLPLLIGPTADDPDGDELRLAWELMGADIMGWPAVGVRPWGFWRFEIGEDPRSTQTGKRSGSPNSGCCDPTSWRRSGSGRTSAAAGRHRPRADLRWQPRVGRVGRRGGR